MNRGGPLTVELETGQEETLDVETDYKSPCRIKILARRFLRSLSLMRGTCRLARRSPWITIRINSTLSYRLEVETSSRFLKCENIHLARILKKYCLI